MVQTIKTKPYDLEERTFLFAMDVALFVKTLPKTISNIEYSRQVVRSSGSVGSNYIEANESLGKKDFAHKIKICRKETKESCLWLRLIEEDSEELKRAKSDILKEAIELRNIFTAILNKAS